MYELDDVLKDVAKMIFNYQDGSIEKSFYQILYRYLLLEQKHKEAVLLARKPIYHYFMYALPSTFPFEFLYHVNNPVRFALETFDSIEDIREELNR